MAEGGSKWEGNNKAFQSLQSRVGWRDISQHGWSPGTLLVCTAGYEMFVHAGFAWIILYKDPFARINRFFGLMWVTEGRLFIVRFTGKRNNLRPPVQYTVVVRCPWRPFGLRPLREWHHTVFNLLPFFHVFMCICVCSCARFARCLSDTLLN